MRNTLLLLVIAVLGGLAGLLVGKQFALPPERPAPAGLNIVGVGDTVPALSWPQLDGTTAELAALRGRPVLINYWASWCGPCIKEMPVLDAFAAEQGEHGVQVLGVALDSEVAVREFLAKLPVDYRIALEIPSADDSSVRMGNRQSVLPFSVLIDAEGKVTAQKAGSFSHKALAQWTSQAVHQGNLAK
jgi:thiol-disulfide isomerase/thioredoxin